MVIARKDKDSGRLEIRLVSSEAAGRSRAHLTIGAEWLWRQYGGSPGRRALFCDQV